MCEIIDSLLINHKHRYITAPWLCPSCVTDKSPDHIKNYSEAMLFFTLLDMVHRDALREGDGVALKEQARFHMPLFWKNRHNKYMICEHRFLAGKFIIWDV